MKMSSALNYNSLFVRGASAALLLLAVGCGSSNKDASEEASDRASVASSMKAAITAETTRDGGGYRFALDSSELLSLEVYLNGRNLVFKLESSKGGDSLVQELMDVMDEVAPMYSSIVTYLSAGNTAGIKVPLDHTSATVAPGLIMKVSQAMGLSAKDAEKVRDRAVELINEATR